MEKLVSLCKRRGFIFPGSEIYGGLAGTYDYGPLGVLLKQNLKAAWWKRVVQERGDCSNSSDNRCYHCPNYSKCKCWHKPWKYFLLL